MKSVLFIICGRVVFDGGSRKAGFEMCDGFEGREEIVFCIQ